MGMVNAVLAHIPLILCRDAGRVADAAASMQRAGKAPAAAYTADLASLAGVRRLCTSVLKDFAHIDILVNNAGVYMEEYMCVHIQCQWHTIAAMPQQPCSCNHPVCNEILRNVSQSIQHHNAWWVQEDSRWI